MNKTALIMGQEIQSTLRRRTFVFFAFGLPLLLGAIAALFMFLNRDAATSPQPADVSAAEASVRQGYVDPGGLIGELPAGIPAEQLQRYDSEEAAQAAVEDGNIDGYFLVPADYVNSGQVRYITPAYNPLGDDVATDALQWTLLTNLLGDEELAAAVQQPLLLEWRSLQPVEEAAGDNWLIELFPMLMVMILYLVIVMTAGNLVNAIADEKKNRVLEVVLSAASPQQFISGKILASGFLGLLQIILWAGILWAVVRFGGQPLAIPTGFTLPTPLLVWLLVYAFLGYAMYGALMAGLGALAPDVKDTRSASFVVLLPFIIGYMLMFPVIEKPDSLLALFVSFFPLTGPVGMIARMAAGDVPLWQGIVAAALQALTAVLIIRLVARLFRAQLLLSGQPFSTGRFFGVLLGRP